MSYDQAHAERYARSLEWIAPLADKAGKILDVGGESPFTKTIRQTWPGKLQPYYNGDLRRGFVVPDCDLILAMEVLEHLSDIEREDEIPHCWTGSGAQMFLASCWMSLKPGGALFLTTPNGHSATVIYKALNLEPPMLFRPHTREYSVYELDELIRQAGFEIVRRETLDVWRNAISDRAWRDILSFIRRYGYNDDLRGEDIFVLCRRPMDK
jgi:SAM-dependent methyltransferase